jgi:lipopolysaccharide/colanic/teichoic acid biosynthesis glycosyltransferase
MRLWPVVLDCQPAYLNGHNRTLLSVPLGTTTIIAHLRATLDALTTRPPTLVSPPSCELREYRTRALSACPNAANVCTPEEFGEALATQELSDAMLIIDLRHLLIRELEIAALVAHHAAEPRSLHHLVTFDTGIDRTKERVSFDAEGQVRAIRRHYERATWTSISGVSATILPVACGVMGERLVIESLGSLRTAMATRGTPSRDVPSNSGAFDLTQESGLLAANERFILSRTGDSERRGTSGGEVYIGGGQSVHPTARFIGPVIIHRDVVVEEQALVVGPAVLGAGARIGSRVIIGHTVVGPGAIVPDGATVHGRAWFETGERDVRRPSENRLPPSYTERIDRVIVERHAHDHPWSGSPPRRYVRVKRALDAAIAGLSLLLLTPVMLAIAVMVKLQGDDGPVFYGDDREGLDGRGFRCWKFRTMASRADAAQLDLRQLDQTDGPHFKVARDPRVTRLGKLLRASNFDELPQLWNVLIGEMSLVGPRPSPFRENQVCVPWREARISVRPGITGLWQVCRHDRAAGDFHQWIEYDVLYVQHISFLLDLKILAGTILTLGGKVTHLRPSWLIGTGLLDGTISDRSAA